MFGTVLEYSDAASQNSQLYVEPRSSGTGRAHQFEGLAPPDGGPQVRRLGPASAVGARASARRMTVTTTMARQRPSGRISKALAVDRTRAADVGTVVRCVTVSYIPRFFVTSLPTCPRRFPLLARLSRSAARRRACPCAPPLAGPLGARPLESRRMAGGVGARADAPLGAGAGRARAPTACPRRRRRRRTGRATPSRPGRAGALGAALPFFPLQVDGQAGRHAFGSGPRFFLGPGRRWRALRGGLAHGAFFSKRASCVVHAGPSRRLDDRASASSPPTLS